MDAKFRPAYASWLIATALTFVALYPYGSARWSAQSVASRVRRLDARLAREPDRVAALDPVVSLRVQKLGPLLASWEVVGGCGAGSSGGAGNVKWIGRSTTGGLFQNVTQLNYIHLDTGPNFVLSTQFTRDLSDRWNVGVFVPFVYKRYNDYMGLPLDISNGGLGDINLLGTFRMGPIRATSLTLSLGLPTGTHDAKYRNDLLTQEKQLGLGRVTGTLTLDHTLDETWGLIVLGGMASYRGGENELKNYRAPFASVYGYAGYFLGPFVPALGLTLTGFPNPDRDRGLDQEVPLVLIAPNASIEWATDWIAVLLGISVPIGLYGKDSGVDGLETTPGTTGLQPWTLALGVSVSPF